MSGGRQRQALACAALLLATITVTVIKMLGPVGARARPAVTSDRLKVSEAKLKYTPTPEPLAFEIPGGRTELGLTMSTCPIRRIFDRGQRDYWLFFQRTKRDDRQQQGDTTHLLRLATDCSSGILSNARRSGRFPQKADHIVCSESMSSL